MDIAEQQRQYEKQLKIQVERFKSESKEEREKRIIKVCVNCMFARANGDKFIWCNYDVFHGGKLRPCAGRDCVELGVFKPKQKGKKSVQRKLQGL